MPDERVPREDEIEAEARALLRELIERTPWFKIRMTWEQRRESLAELSQSIVLELSPSILVRLGSTAYGPLLNSPPAAPAHERQR
jgi:hypothetical protein